MNEGVCRFLGKGCLNGEPACGNGKKIICVQADRWEKLDGEKCPALTFTDGCDCSRFRLILTEHTGSCYEGSNCKRALYPEETQMSLNPNPDWNGIAQSLAARVYAS